MSADKQVRLTAMAHAFVAAVGKPNAHYKLAMRVARVGSRKGAGEVQERGWDAKVSFRTAQKLKQAEVL